VLSSRLLERLADGRPHSGTVLAAAAGVDCDELPGLLRALVDAGLELREGADGSIALARPIRWISHPAVAESIPAPARARVERIDCLLQHESTNRFLFDCPCLPTWPCPLFLFRP
jgi:hypothetical protein